ncbi:MAG: cellulase family glycosylhydrolase, partial [Polyangiaceae bacterium]
MGAQDGGGSTPPGTGTDGGPIVGADASTWSSSEGGSVSNPDASSDATTDAGVFNLDGGYPAGWLYTSGGAIYESRGASPAARWMGRGVNMDDIFLCGYNNSLSTQAPDHILETIAAGLMNDWKPSFVRISLGMASFAPVSWLDAASPYRTQMTNVIRALGSYANVHVLVTLRSDGSMIGQDTASGNPEATGLPSDQASTPDSTKFPTGTDATYVALVDTFATDGFVMFGLSNEPGGNTLANGTIAAAMTHAVGVIRREEDRLGVPHHIVSVQGNGWTSDISFYASAPIPDDNVVYEVHGYPPATGSYTYSTIPVILGEYGSLTSSAATAFYADVEGKQIPNLAWDFEPYSDCAPDLLNVTDSASNLTTTSWG